MKKDTKLRTLAKAEIAAVAGGNSDLQNAVGGGVARGSGKMFELGDTFYFPNGISISLGKPTVK